MVELYLGGADTAEVGTSRENQEALGSSSDSTKKWAHGLWTPNTENWFFAGHFPGRPTLPGVLMVESIAQLGAYLLLSDEAYKSKLPLFGGIDKVRFKRQVLPEETLELEIEMLQLSGRAGKGRGTAKVEGDLACSAELMFVIVSN